MVAPPRRSQRLAVRASSAAANRVVPDHDRLERDWASLSPMVDLVAERVLDDDVFGFVRFRAVCKPWREGTRDPRALGAGVINHRFHPRRWIMLPGPAGGTRRNLLDVATRKVVEVDLPELAGHAVVAGSAAAPEGMLVLRNESTLVVRLLNPLTRHVVDLPSVRTLQLRGSRRGPISSTFREEHAVTAAGFANEFTVVVYFGRLNQMAVAKPGDARWTLVRGLESPLLSTFTFQGRFYCIDHERLMAVDLAQRRRPQLVVAAGLNRRLYNVNMVDDDGKLMVVCSRITRLDGQRGVLQTVIELFHVDLEAQTLLPIHDLGEQAVFAGSLGAVLLPSTRHYRSVDPDTVYFRFGQSQRRFGAFRVRRRRTAYLPSVEGRLAKHIASYVTLTHSE